MEAPAKEVWGAVNSISNTGSGGEIHLLSGTVSTPDGSGAPEAVSLSNAGTNPLRLVMASSAFVLNADTTINSHAISVSGGGSVFLELAGTASAVGGNTIHARAQGAGNVDINITGGRYTTTSGHVVFGDLFSTKHRPQRQYGQR